MIPRIVVLAKDKQGFIRNACNYSCGRIRSRAKIKATASDGAENAGEHITTSFLAMGIEKGGVKKGPNTTKKDLEPASGTNPFLCDIIYLT